MYASGEEASTLGIPYIVENLEWKDILIYQSLGWELRMSESLVGLRTRILKELAELRCDLRTKS